MASSALPVHVHSIFRTRGSARLAGNTRYKKGRLPAGAGALPSSEASFVPCHLAEKRPASLRSSSPFPLQHCHASIWQPLSAWKDPKSITATLLSKKGYWQGRTYKLGRAHFFLLHPCEKCRKPRSKLLNQLETRRLRANAEKPPPHACRVTQLGCSQRSLFPPCRRSALRGRAATNGARSPQLGELPQTRRAQLGELPQTHRAEPAVALCCGTNVLQHSQGVLGSPAAHTTWR